MHVQTCEDLDRRAGMTESVLWPVEPEPEQEEGVGDEAEIPLDPDAAAFQELPAADRLLQTLLHLRQTYHYCLFCGHQVKVVSPVTRVTDWQRYQQVSGHFAGIKAVYQSFTSPLSAT